MSATGSLRVPRTDVSARVRRQSSVEASAPVREPASAPFSVLLEEGTAKTRQQAERSLFLETLFADTWDGGVYGQFVRAQHYVSYLRQLHYLYAAFESVLPRVVDSPLTPVLLLPELRRASALEADLLYFCGETRTESFACLEARVHAQRLREVAEEAPHLLVAHAYARCMLDLFTGPARVPCITAAFELDDARGTRFYDALTASELAAFRVRLHSRIDGLELDADEMREVIQEARMAFRLHALVCDELARGAPGITARSTGAAPCPPR
ncbi:biliverdin-producing heme oxygenase [Pyxidicoccus parkwayensis]|uniref:Biliverdin-producing heme oxygenase n=1 Tax=Pyxidicoccus parkwayensis TaxID=2813578 RepID=A0ABX7NZ06_9BACT|nr:biliverdin-producing heme oxygenase [Pyxidicoccus parkwaysis]QSQ23958.1 biliverdin-producing heme oxygenase [Pyxidicoccus parkwaysis]